MAHYLDLHAEGGQAVATVNGFPVFHGGDGGSTTYSGFITIYLRNGKNQVHASLTGDAGAHENSLGLGVVAAPVSKIRSADNPDTVLAQADVTGVSRLRFVDLEPDQYEILKGEVTPKSGPLALAGISNRRWAWGCRMTGPDGLPHGRLYKLSYNGLDGTLVHAEVHLLRSGTNQHLAFGSLTLPKGDGEILVSQAAIIRGSEWLEADGFDEIWMFGTGAAGLEKMHLSSLNAEFRQSRISIKEEPVAELANKWAWLGGENVKQALAVENTRRDVVEYLKTLHTTVSTKPAEDWQPFFEIKRREMATAAGKSDDQSREEELAFFKSLTEIKGWKLEPFDPARLLLTPINDQVVLASYVETDGPLQSVPIIQPGTDKLDRFAIPLYLSLIQGKWTLVR